MNISYTCFACAEFGTYTRIGLRCSRAMRNVTVTLPEDLALWLRVRAARIGKSRVGWLICSKG